MRKLKLIIATATIGFLAGCSGSDNTLVVDPTIGTGITTAPVIGSLSLLTSDPALDSDGSETATLTALVLDSDNIVMPEIPVAFSADSGSLVVTQPPITDANGVLTALLTPGGDPTNRTITITATAGATTATLLVPVVGTTVAVTGPPSLPLGQTAPYEVLVTDSEPNGQPISGVSVTIASALGNTITGSPVVTDVNGRGTFALTADMSGDDSITASALGAISAPYQVRMSGDAFSFSAPAPQPVPEIPLNSSQSVTVNWQQSGVPVNGQSVSFTTTRGVLTPTSALTVGGNATVDISAANAGPAIITATNSDGTTTQLEVEFVATDPETLELQASPLTIGVNEQSTITATVRDIDGNLVKNQTIDFSLTDITGGQLSVGQSVTNSAGQAKTTYTASTTTSATEGVQVDAKVQGSAPGVAEDAVNLTVAQRAQFLSIGTGNSIQEINEDSQYRVVYAIQVTDAQGRGVPDVPVQVSVLSDFYMKGHREFPLGGGSWTTVVTATCPDEDINRNGILDPGEDANSNGRIEANNIAAVSPTTPGTLDTDEFGYYFVNVDYPQEFAYYVDVTLQATAAEVGGTEFAEAVSFILTGAASDFNNQNIAPPGEVSQFGDSMSCADTL